MAVTDDFLNSLTDSIVEKAVCRLREEGLFDRKEEKAVSTDPRIAYGISEMARRLGTTTWNIRQWLKNGILDGCYLETGNMVIFNLDLFERKFKENKTAGIKSEEAENG